MKRVALLFLLSGWLVPVASAQETEHVQVGVFADYIRLHPTDTNMAGVGVRLGVMAYQYVKLEGETSYDFTQAFTERFSDTRFPGRVTTSRTNFRILHGEFGPKFAIGHYPLRPFVVLKGGFMNFRLSNAPATIGTFFSSTSDLRSSDLNAVFYPGAGLEGHVGPVGLRLDVGDQIYFNNGANHNLRVTFGPYIRF